MLNSPPVSLALALAQVMAWRFWRAALPKCGARSALGYLYLAVNAMSVSVLMNWYWSAEAPPANHLVWTWFYRPALIWQLVHLAWLVLSGISIAVHAPIRALIRPRGTPYLFKAKRPAPRLKTWRILLLAALAAVAARGYLLALSPPGIVLAEAPVRDLPPALDGLTVALISDLRYGRGANASDLAEILALLGERRPDVVVSLGALVDKSSALAADLAGPVAALAPKGFYAVLGETELASDSPAGMARALALAGIDVLEGRGAAVSDLPLYLAAPDLDRGHGGPVGGGRAGAGSAGGGQAGAGPPGAGSSGAGSPGGQAGTGSAWTGPAGAGSGPLHGPPPPEGALVVVATRRPRPAGDLAGLGARLYLAGPPEPGLAPSTWDLFGERTEALYGPGPGGGLHKVGDMVVCLTRGLSGPFPFRLWRGPEMTVLTLRASPS